MAARGILFKLRPTYNICYRYIGAYIYPFLFDFISHLFSSSDIDCKMQQQCKLPILRY